MATRLEDRNIEPSDGARRRAVRSALADWSSILLAGCALVLTVAVLLRIAPLGWRGDGATWHPIEEVSASALIDEGLLVGAAEAPIRAVVFTNFLCGACSRQHGALDSLRAALPDLVSVTYRHFVTDREPYARDAAMFVECAAEQGHLEGTLDAVFGLNGQVLPSDFGDLIGQLNLEATVFATCMRGRYAERVSDDTRLVGILGPVEPPLVIMDGAWRQGFVPYADLYGRAAATLRRSER